MKALLFGNLENLGPDVNNTFLHEVFHQIQFEYLGDIKVGAKAGV